LPEISLNVPPLCFRMPLKVQGPKGLKGPKGRYSELVTVEFVLPWWIMRLPFARRWWLSLKTPPMPNWILQRLVKLSSPCYTSEDVLVFVDSDVAFVRPFDLQGLVREGKVNALSSR